jgi:hypothetical protein
LAQPAVVDNKAVDRVTVHGEDSVASLQSWCQAALEEGES